LGGDLARDGGGQGVRAATGDAKHDQLAGGHGEYWMAIRRSPQHELNKLEFAQTRRQACPDSDELSNPAAFIEYCSRAAGQRKAMQLRRFRFTQDCR
jgi:hypothetical protein